MRQLMDTFPHRLFADGESPAGKLLYGRPTWNRNERHRRFGGASMESLSTGTAVCFSPRSGTSLTVALPSLRNTQNWLAR